MTQEINKKTMSTCPIQKVDNIHPQSLFTKCYELGLEIKVQDISATGKIWFCE